mgnify:FL=1
MMSLVAWALAGCAGTNREDILNRATVKGFQPQIISTASFDLYSLERVRARGGDVHIYIEGDGFAWVSRTRPSRDPTPKNPVALDLATRDMAENVVYLARPCQYTMTRLCDQRYWTSHRYAPDILSAFIEAVDHIKAQHEFDKIHFIGFSGGANIAALIAAKRDDVASLRTVAGNLNHALLHEIHGVSQIPQSLNAVNFAKDISGIPQHHFIGSDDKIIGAEIVRSFINASGQTNCLIITKVPGATHQSGWREHWPEIMAQPLTCGSDI